MIPDTVDVSESLSSVADSLNRLANGDEKINPDPDDGGVTDLLRNILWSLRDLNKSILDSSKETRRHNNKFELYLSRFEIRTRKRRDVVTATEEA